MPTLDAVRAEIGALSQGPGFWVGTVGSAWTADTLQDALLVDPTRGAQFYVRQYVRRTGAGVGPHQLSRRIVAYDPALGRVDVAYPWSPVPPAGEPYEIGWKWEPGAVEAAIRRVHGRMYAAVEVPIDAVANQLQYPLTDAAAWLQYASQAERVVVRTGADGQRASTVLDGASLRQVATNGVQQVIVDLVGDPLGTADTLNVRAYIPFQLLTPLSDGPSTTIAPLAWVAWEAIWELLQLPLMNLDDELRRRAGREVGQLRKGALPPPSHQLFIDQGTWGSPGVGRF